MKPIELANKANLDKSLISNYLSGKYKAKQDKLTIIAKVLDVNEVWLMGYDVPDDPNFNSDIKGNEYAKMVSELTEDDLDILDQYKILFDKDNKLTDNQKEFILNTIEEQHRKIDEEIEKGNVN